MLQVFELVYNRLYPGFVCNGSVTTGSSLLENCRVVYTTYNNINVWFDTLKEFLTTNGFARNKQEDGDREWVFFRGQLNRILNLDESGLMLDSNQSKSGGKSSTHFSCSNPSIPQGMDQTNKSSTRIAFIGGSTAADHLLPPHFQLKLVATDENKRIQTKFLDGLQFVYGVYGMTKLIKFGPNVSCNASAGMDATESRKIILDAIVPLYPNAAEMDTKHVLLIL